MTHRPIVVALTVVLASGCGAVGATDEQSRGKAPTLNMQEAGVRAEEMLDETSAPFDRP